MSLPRILVFGHSHMGALLDAYGEAVNDNRSFKLVSYQFMRSDRPHIVHTDGKWRYHPECEDELRRLIDTTGPAAVVIMLQGEQAASAGMIAPDRPFEFYFPGQQSDVGAITEIVPYDMMIETCRYEHRLISQLLDDLRSTILVPAYALSPPPPIGDSEFILASNPKHANIAGHLAKRGLPSINWRYRMWKLHTLALQTIYEERGMVFVDPPRESHGEDGFLLQPFWSDVFHANSQYGRLLMRQIESFVASGP
jgi:hypothetical protein